MDVDSHISSHLCIIREKEVHTGASFEGAVTPQGKGKKVKKKERKKREKKEKKERRKL